MKCGQCAHLDTDTWPSHFDAGFGHCKRQSAGSFVGLTRDKPCEMWSAAGEQVVQQRRDKWKAVLDKRRKK